jgi:hypothetical protein
LQSELLRPEVISYAIEEFGRQLRAALSDMSGDLVSLRRRKNQLESEIQRFADAIARGGTLDALVEQIAARERELKSITNRLLSSSAESINGGLHDIRAFAEQGLRDLRLLLNRDARLAKAELHRHLSEIRMIPTEGRQDWHYVADGTWDILGTGPNVPVIELAHSDGCGGPQPSELFSAAF